MGTGNGTRKQMGYYILCRTVHITLEWWTELDTIGFHTNFSGPSPGPGPRSVQCVCAIKQWRCRGKNIFVRCVFLRMAIATLSRSQLWAKEINKKTWHSHAKWNAILTTLDRCLFWPWVRGMKEGHAYLHFASQNLWYVKHRNMRVWKVSTSGYAKYHGTWPLYVKFRHPCANFYVRIFA